MFEKEKTVFTKEYTKYSATCKESNTLVEFVYYQ